MIRHAGFGFANQVGQGGAGSDVKTCFPCSSRASGWAVVFRLQSRLAQKFDEQCTLRKGPPTVQTVQTSWISATDCPPCLKFRQPETSQAVEKLESASIELDRARLLTQELTKDKEHDCWVSLLFVFASCSTVQLSWLGFDRQKPSASCLKPSGCQDVLKKKGNWHTSSQWKQSGSAFNSASLLFFACKSTLLQLSSQCDLGELLIFAMLVCPLLWGWQLMRQWKLAKQPRMIEQRQITRYSRFAHWTWGCSVNLLHFYSGMKFQKPTKNG